MFDPWRRWRLRERLSDELDVPREFGILGLYLLATSEVCVSNHAHSDLLHINSNVIYIGMSKHVTQRLEKHHGAVHRYRQETDDTTAEYLMYSQWMSPWTTYRVADPKSSRYFAYVRYLERKLIWEYARDFDRLPRFNRA